MSANNKAVLESANAAVTSGDNEGFLSFCTDDTLWTFVGERTLRGKEAVRQWMTATYKQPPKLKVDHLIAEGDFVTALGEVTTTDADGKATRYAYCDVWRFRDGKMAELRAFVIETNTQNSDQGPEPVTDLLRTAYAAFNARDIDAALSTMAPDVTWPKAFKGGVARGHREVRAYWTEQWSEIDPRVEPTSFHAEKGGRILVHVHQVVRDLDGEIVSDGHVGHRFTIASGRITSMEVCPLPSPDRAAGE